MIWLIGHLLAACVGISLGLLGGGGSVLALPILVYIMGIAPKTAIAMTLIVVGAGSLVGVIPHWRRGNINLKTALVFGTATMIGAFGGARLAASPFVTDTFQMLLFASMMLLAAGFMIQRTTQAGAPTVHQDAPDALSLYSKPICKSCWLWLLTEGLGVGVLTGLVGVGGGFAIVPALVLLGKLPMKQAIATSLLIISMNSAAGLAGYAGQLALDWQLTVSFTFTALLGTVLGLYLAQFFSAQQLQKGFGYFLLAIAAFVLVQNRQALQFWKPSASAPAQRASLVEPEAMFQRGNRRSSSV